MARSLGISDGYLRSKRRQLESEGVQFVKRKPVAANQYTASGKQDYQPIPQSLLPPSTSPHSSPQHSPLPQPVQQYPQEPPFLSDDPVVDPKARARAFLQRGVEATLSKYKYPDPVMPRSMPYSPVISIGDMHLPWWHKPTIDVILEFIRVEAAKFPRLSIVQLGDIYDMYAHSRFPTSRVIYNPAEEFEIARSQGEWFWTEVRKAAPQASCYQLKGNHDIRPIKRLMESAPELEMWFDIDHIWKFDGVDTIQDPREPLIIDDVAYIHGWMAMGKHMYNLQRSCVHGHLHGNWNQPNTIMRKVNGQWLFEMDSGYVGDPGAKSMEYVPNKITTWTRGVGIVKDYGPQWIPFE